MKWNNLIEVDSEGDINTCGIIYYSYKDKLYEMDKHDVSLFKETAPDYTRYIILVNGYETCDMHYTEDDIEDLKYDIECERFKNAKLVNGEIVVKYGKGGIAK